MSSFIAHALVGASCLVLARPKTFKQALPLVLIGGLLGLSPDIDYLLLWLADWRPSPRITHSIVFTSVASLSAWIFIRVCAAEKATVGLFCIFFAAATSHLMLDALVGVTKNPIAWPVSSDGFNSPIGFLPSAGTPNLFNVYFWRNLTIELGIVVPLLTVGFSMTRTIEFSWLSWRGLLGVGVFVVSVYSSLSLTR